MKKSLFSNHNKAKVAKVSHESFCENWEEKGTPLPPCRIAGCPDVRIDFNGEAYNPGPEDVWDPGTICNDPLGCLLSK